MPRFSPPSRFTWPDGRRCAAMLCFDVDGETTALSEACKTRPAAARSCRNASTGPRIGVPRLLGGARALWQVPATFFIPGHIAEHHPRMVEAIVARGP